MFLSILSIQERKGFMKLLTDRKFLYKRLLDRGKSNLGK